MTRTDVPAASISMFAHAMVLLALIYAATHSSALDGTSPGRGSGPGSGAGRGPGNRPGEGTGDVYEPGSGGVSEPKLIHEVKPNFTVDAMRAKIQGVVVMDIVVLADGTVDSSRIRI